MVYCGVVGLAVDILGPGSSVLGWLFNGEHGHHIDMKMRKQKKHDPV